MIKQSLNGAWQINWTDGQRGGTPYFIKDDWRLPNLDADYRGHKKTFTERYDAVKWIDAAVPGEVHLDLWRAGLIDDPYIETNVLKCRWVEEYIWYYRKVFDAPDIFNKKHAVLTFEGLDYGAIVYLNGEEVARHENAFYPLHADVSGKLKSHGNILVVRLESGLYTVSEKPIRNLHCATLTADSLLHKRQWMRKIQSSFAWDWSPRLINVGVYKDVTLSGSDRAIVNQCSVRTDTQKDLQSATAEVRLFCCACEPLEYELEVSLDGETHRFVQTTDATGMISGEISVQTPRLWYPTGYGDPHLYEVTVRLLQGGEVLYEHQTHTGFRHVEVDQSPHPDKGNYFNFIINGTRIFAKGANIVPTDMITAAIDYERYDKLTDLALDANFNFLRVWGGGLYESDDFYTLCDQKGIMVWQDFISACATLPCGDDAFINNFEQDAVFNIRRLSRYPSLIAWCGNNEVDVDGLESFFGYDLPHDRRLYFELLPALIKREDPEKYYQPASPYSFDGSSTMNDFVGDQHPWAVGFTDKDHRKYREMECRFPNEGGVLGSVSLPTTMKCLSETQQRMHSFDWVTHDNSLETALPGTSADENVKFWLNIDPRELTLPQAVFASGYVQSLGLGEYIDAFRNKKFTCGSAVFWMYNDCWPCTRSWTIVDYYLNRTPSFHPVRRAFAPMRVIPRTVGGQGVVCCVNGTLLAFSGSVRYGVCDASGNLLIDRTAAFSAAANQSSVIAKLEEDEFASLGSNLFFAILTDEKGQTVSQNITFDALVHELPLEQTEIDVKLEDGFAVFSSSKPVLGICLDLDGTEKLSDNLFDLLPNIPYRIEWAKATPPEILMTVNSLLHSLA